ncbi:MAG: M14 family zinc carboxypeptidase [Candidatus Krumholzibacteriia bacterium]
MRVRPAARVMLLVLGVTFPGAALRVQPAPARQAGGTRVDFASGTWDATFFFPNGTYDPAIPTPESILGFPVGRQPLRSDDMRRYFEALDAASPRATMILHGRTHEGRELIHLAIGSQTRVSREGLTAVRESIARFADPRTGGGDEVPDDMPLVAWFGYSIHGDELSGCDAAVQVAYQLAAGTDALTRRIRENVLVFIDPLQNPDGRERYLAQMRAARGRVPNPDDQSLQHRGFWPWGRANHYLFDLNRDWFYLVHPESQGRVSAMRSWNPQLVIDGHEMGWNDTYLFSPPREPFNPNLPRAIRHWWDVFAADQAAAFDSAGWSHYTREWNEEFFPGYGSSWAMYHGAIGILYEQASTDGSVVRQKDGTYLTYREAVLHQFQSTLSILGTASRHRLEILRDFRRGRREAIAAGRQGPVRAFVYVPGANPERALHLTRTLAMQGIEVHRARKALTLRDAHDVWGGSWRRKQLPAGSYVVLLEQPLYPLIRNLMDFHVAMPDSFLREERDYLERDKGSRLYEVTTWSLPVSYNIETYWTAHAPRGDLDPLALESAAVELPEVRPSYGYLIDGDGDAAMHAVALLLERGMSIRVALEPFHAAGRSFPRGSALLRVQANPETLHDVVRSVALETGAVIHATDSGRSDEGPDLGGNRFPVLEPARVALLTGSPVSFVSYGSLWHLLDHDLGVRVSCLDVQNLRGMHLDKYNVLVMPDVFGGADAYERALGPDGIETLQTWVNAGGTLVAVGAGAAFAADTTRSLSEVRLRRQVLQEFAPSMAHLPLPESPRMDALGDEPRGARPAAMPLLGPGARRFVRQVRPRGVRDLLEKKAVTSAETGAEADEEADPKHLERADRRLRRFRPQGALLRLDVDQDHWLTAGLPARLPALVGHDRAFIARAPVRVAARFAPADSLHVSGLLWPEAADRLARTAYLTRERRGKGQVILFSGDPTYRRATRGVERLILNAIFLGPGLGVSRPAPW